MAPKSKKTKTAGPEYTLMYWNARGRAEPIRLTLAYAGLEWKEVHNTDENQAELKKKAGTEEMPFGQWPLLKEGDVTLAQGQAIMKHLARKCGMYGARNKFEDYLVDSFMIGAEALYNKLADGVLWGEGDKAENASKFESKHLDPSTKTERNGGAHLAYLEGFLERSETEWIAGGKKPSIADLYLFHVYDSIAANFDREKLAKNYPKVAANAAAFAEIETIAEYLKSEKRPKA